MENLKNFTVADWLKLVAVVSSAGAAGFATGGYVGLAVNLVGALGTLLASPPGKISIPK